MRRQRDDLGILGLGPARFRIRDWAKESTLSVIRHPGRSIMTALGNVLGAAAFVATLGISTTMSWQVSDSFDVRRATEVRVVPASTDTRPGWLATERIDRLRALNGVAAAGRRLSIPEQPMSRMAGGKVERATVLGADPGAIAVMAPRLTIGRLPDAFHERQATAVALLSASVANSLQIRGIGMAVFIEDRPFTVIGIFDDVQRRPEALVSAIVPASVADSLARPDQRIERDVVIGTAAGAAQLVAGQAPYALWPEAPAQLRSIAPPDPRTLRVEVEGSVGRSSLILSIIALVIGALSITGTATASVSARTAEIGLRRAVGGRRRHVFLQLLGETTVLGSVGGLVGVLLGIGAIAVVSLTNRWTPVIDLRTALLALAATSAVGLLAGLWPAVKATRIQPVAALQR